MKKNYSKLPLRKGVGIVLLNNKNKVFVAKRIDNPKNFWQMPQGGVDENENYYEAALRELKEETNLNGEFVKLLGNCSHFNSIFGDILLLGMEMKIENWDNIKVGDDASDAKLFDYRETPPLAFECHIKFLNMYINLQKIK